MTVQILKWAGTGSHGEEGTGEVGQPPQLTESVTLLGPPVAFISAFTLPLGSLKIIDLIYHWEFRT